MNWLAKEFSKLAHVSVRTLHHYDEIGLLKPSLRSSGNYRLYSEGDLFRLQCITALKSFGFNLKQIQILLDDHASITSQLEAQRHCLENQIMHARQTVIVINNLMERAKTDNKLAWQDVVSLFEGYRMSKELSESWIVSAFSPDQIKLFVELEKCYTKAEFEDYKDRWQALVKKVNKRLDAGLNLTSPEALALAKEWHALTDEMYGSRPELRDALQMAYRYNKIPHMPFQQRVWDLLEAAEEYHTAKK